MQVPITNIHTIINEYYAIPTMNTNVRLYELETQNFKKNTIVLDVFKNIRYDIHKPLF